MPHLMMGGHFGNVEMSRFCHLFMIGKKHIVMVRPHILELLGYGVEACKSLLVMK